jgi:NADH-quinone oxidoreductase subunit H
MMWVRWTLPRLRIDQVMMTCLKYLLPISCALLLGVSLWQVAMPPVVKRYFCFVLFGGSVLLVAAIIKQWISWASAPPTTGMPGMWRTAEAMGYQASKPT